MPKRKRATQKTGSTSTTVSRQRKVSEGEDESVRAKRTNPAGAILVLLALALVAYWFFQRSQLRALNPGEIYLSGTVARGPGSDCWIINARTGERFNFFGVELGKLRTVGVTAKVIARPEPDKQSPCRQGRVVTVLDYRILKKPNYDR